jgi:acylphosphatase
MRLNANGDMGIGTSSPTDSSLFTRALDLNGTSGAAYYARTNGSANNYTAFGNFGVDGYINNRGAGNIQFYTNGNVERMRITSDGLLQFNSGYGSVATAYGCRAWVNFNGTGTVAIRASGNVSSITDDGTGSYRVNFTNAMPDENYSVSGSMSWVTSGWGNVFTLDSQYMSTTQVGMKSMSQDGNAFTLNDALVACVQIFR